MELSEQVEKTKAVYENLTGKKVNRAKEETLEKIFSSIQSSDAKGTDSKELTMVFENQKALDERIDAVEGKISQLSEKVDLLVMTMKQQPVRSPAPPPQTPAPSGIDLQRA